MRKFPNLPLDVSHCQLIFSQSKRSFITLETLNQHASTRRACIYRFLRFLAILILFPYSLLLFYLLFFCFMMTAEVLLHSVIAELPTNQTEQRHISCVSGGRKYAKTLLFYFILFLCMSFDFKTLESSMKSWGATKRAECKMRLYPQAPNTYHCSQPSKHS